MRNIFASIFTLPILLIPILIFYFIIKLAIKNAIKELKEENIL